MVLGKQQTLACTMGLGAQQVLRAAEKPATVPHVVQRNRAALSLAHVRGLLDSLTDDDARFAAALALVSLEYIEALSRMQEGKASDKRESDELLAAARGEAA